MKVLNSKNYFPKKKLKNKKMKRLFKLFSKENSIRGASIILIITLTLSNILGLLRDRFLTKNISTFDLDIYYASFRIPDLIFNFLILGTITSAFIPIFSDFLAKKNEEEAWHVTNLLLNLALIFTLLSALILYIFMPNIVHIVVPKFDNFRLLETIKYSRLLMLTPVFFSISYIMGGVLNSYKRFFVYSLAPLVYNASIIVGAILAPAYGLKGVVYCVIAGSIFHALIQLPAAIKLGFSYRPVFDFQNATLKRIVKLMLPRTLSMGAGQIMLIIFTAIASALAAGSITAFNLANNIQTVPIVVLGTSFATAIFPTLSEKIAQNDFKNFSFYLNRAIKAIAFLMIPASLIFFLMRAQIVRLILGSGKFGWDDTKMTAITLGLFSLSLLAQGVIPLLARAFYALKNTRTPMYISIFSIVLSIILAYLFARTLSVAGLALAFSIGSYVNAILLFYFLRKNHSEAWSEDLIPSLTRTVIISLIMAVFVWLTMHLMANYVDMTRFTGILIQAMVSGLVGVIIFLTLSYLLNSDELKWAITRKIAQDRSKN